LALHPQHLFRSLAFHDAACSCPVFVYSSKANVSLCSSDNSICVPKQKPALC